MWTLSSPALSLIRLGLAALIALGAAHAASAQNYYNPYNNYVNQTYSYGLYLPQVPQPTGQDEVRAADGTTCRSNAASNDAYLDVGGIGGQGTDGAFTSGTVYGRVIVPLGTVPNRVDCTKLYMLEIERLQHELAMVRSGLGQGGFAPTSGQGNKDDWSNTGWSDSGSSAGRKSTVTSPSTKTARRTDGVVPQHLGGEPDSALLRAELKPRPDAVAHNSGVEAGEILPWSTKPAERGRVLTYIPPKKKRIVADADITPGDLARP